MANRTDPTARSVHGKNLQNLVEKIMRLRIYQTIYWKEQCFGLTAKTLVDKAMELDHFGGTFGGNRKAMPFMCLILKMLQIQPEEIVVECIKNKDYKYVRILGAFYLRLVGKPIDMYRYLIPLYKDYRKLRQRTTEGGYVLVHVDEFIDELLTTDYSSNIALPKVPKSWMLETARALDQCRSALEYDFKEEEEKEEEEVNGLETMDIDEEHMRSRIPEKYRDQDKDQDRFCHRDHQDKGDRDRGRDRDHGCDYDHRKRELDSDQDQDRDHYHDRVRDREKDRDVYDRDQERDRDLRRDRDRDRDQACHRCDRGRDRDREKYRDRGSRSHSRSRSRDRPNCEQDQGPRSVSPHL